MEPRIFVGVDENGVQQVWVEGFELPPATEIIVRDFTKGNTPDVKGDLYEDTMIVKTWP